jgi:hypothetical protein
MCCAVSVIGLLLVAVDAAHRNKELNRIIIYVWPGIETALLLDALQLLMLSAGT